MYQTTLQNHADEIATFIDTGKQLRHRGQEFQILTTTTDQADSPYVLKANRGIYYALVRNKPNPHHLFAVSLYEGGMKTLKGWFCDRNDQLISLDP
jgi:hypothetical protein